MSVLNNPLLFGFLGAPTGGIQPVEEISRSVRFNSGDTSYLNRTPASASNRKTWTWSGWVKRSVLGVQQSIFGNSSSSTLRFRFDSDNKLRVLDGGSGSLVNVRTTAVFSDVGAWYHIVLVVDTTEAIGADRTKIYVNDVNQALTYTNNYNLNADSSINNTIEHRISNGGGQGYLDCYVTGVHFIDGLALDPNSFAELDANGIWQPTEYTGTYGTNGFRLFFSDNSSPAALGEDTSGNNNDFTVNNLSTFPNAKNYANTLSISLGSIIDYKKSFDNDLSVGAGGDTNLPNAGASATITFTPTSPISATSLRVNGSFGTTQFVTQEISVNGGSYILGNNAYNSTPAWFDISNQITGGVITSITTRTSRDSTAVFAPFFVNAIEVDGSVLIDISFASNTSSFVDVPTNGTETDTGIGGEVRGNYCTWNPLSPTNSGTYSNGNLNTNVAQANSARGTISVSSGKWYWEITPTNSAGFNQIGACRASSGALAPHVTPDGWAYYAQDGTKWNNSIGTAYGTGYGNGDLIGVAIDMDEGKIWWAKNGTWQNSGDPATGTNPGFTNLSGNIQPMATTASAGGTHSYIANFGQRPFTYAAPSGYKALCTTNLTNPSIPDGQNYMDATLYTGNGGTNAITGLKFSPDLLWFKRRDAANDHIWIDQVRGLSKQLISNSTATEGTDATGVTAVSSTGFTLGTGTLYGNFNGNGGQYVAWTWDAGDSTVTNNDGNITSEVRTRPTAGFSIVTADSVGNGATIGHGLGVNPSMVIIKTRDIAGIWNIQGHIFPNPAADYMRFNSTVAKATDTNAWNNTAATSSVFSINATYLYGGTPDLVAYCWAAVEGYSSFGTYTGNGSANGPFVYTGFRPAFVIVKRTDAASLVGWYMWDSKRDGYNLQNNSFNVNTTGVEYSATATISLLSNGFKLLDNYADRNANNGAYIYMAVAENPFALNVRAR